MLLCFGNYAEKRIYAYKFIALWIMTVNGNILKIISMQLDIGLYKGTVFLAATLLLLFYEISILNIIKYRSRYRVVNKAYWTNAFIPIVFVSLYNFHADL